MGWSVKCSRWFLPAECGVMFPGVAVSWASPLYLHSCACAGNRANHPAPHTGGGTTTVRTRPWAPLGNVFPAHVVQLYFFRLLVHKVFVFGQQRLWLQRGESPNLSSFFLHEQLWSFPWSVWLPLGKPVHCLLPPEGLKEEKARQSRLKDLMLLQKL